MNIYDLIPETTKYIILDFDETIAKTKHIWPEANRRWFQMFNVNDDVNDFDKAAQNMVMTTTCELLKQRNPYITHSVEELAQGAEQICNEIAAECDFVPGADIFIKETHKLNIAMCIATNSPVQFVQSFFSTKDQIFQQIFTEDKIFSGSNTKLRKSDPQFYAESFIKCFKQPEDAFKDLVIIEDSLYAIKSSAQLKSKGVYVLAIKNKDDGRHQLANKVIQDFLG